MSCELLTGRKILLVEDHDGFRSLLTAFLLRYGALITACASISAAIDSVTRARPDLVITDIGLSDGDGFQLLRVIQKLDLESGTKTPVLAMSAHADLILGNGLQTLAFQTSCASRRSEQLLPPACDVPELLDKIIAEAALPSEPLAVVAARLHLRLVRVHPFRDGNGRTARLASTLLLVRGGVRSTLLMAVEQHSTGILQLMSMS
jgi:CheY-like chemotaxis protein